MSLVPDTTFSSPGVSLFAPASGGGGGPVNPNQAFSSITLATGSTVFPDYGTPGTINFTGEVSLVNSQDQMKATFFSPANGAVSWAIQTPGADGGIQIGSDGSTAFITTLNRVLPISMVSNSGVNISSLNVSSINGATPGGGGVGPNPAFSTITVSSISAIGKNTVGITGPLTVQGSLEATAQIIADAGVEVATGQTLAFIGGTGQISGVSTINSVAYPPPAVSNATRVALANNTGQDIALPANGVPGSFVACSANYSVTAGHTYRVTSAIDLSGISSGVFSLAVVGIAVAPLPETILNRNNDGNNYGTGVVSTFSPTNSGVVYVGAVNTGTDPTIFTVSASNWIFEDLGAL